MGVIYYKYYNSTPELLSKILANLQAQNNWQKVPKDEGEYSEATIVEYCNQDFSIIVRLYDDMQLGIYS